MASTEPETLLSSRRPWSEVLSLNLSLPTSLDAALSRVSSNLSHFRFNYSIVLSLLALALCHVWLNLFASLAVGGFLVCLHAALWDWDGDSPYGALLSDHPDSPMGAYTSM